MLSSDNSSRSISAKRPNRVTITGYAQDSYRNYR
jgi:hypothetical protein